MAVSDRFQGAYRRLSNAFGAHHDAPRDPDRVLERAAARAALEDRRTEMKAARDDEGLPPFRRENPDWVDPDIGTGATGRIGKALAVIGALVLVGGLVLIGLEVRNDGVDDDLVVGELGIEAEPTADGGCVVSVAGVLRNESSNPMRVIAVNFDAIERGSGASLDTWPGQVDRGYLDPGVTATVAASFVVPATLADPAPCPSSPGGVLRVTYAAPTGPLLVATVEL